MCFHRRRLGAEFGDGEKFRRPKFVNDLFTPKISDDPFLSHRPYFFQILRFCLSVFIVSNHIYGPIFTTKTSIFIKKIPLHDTSSCFRTHPTTLLLKILGGTDAWAVPQLKFWGRPPTQSPRSLRPCVLQFAKPIIMCRLKLSVRLKLCYSAGIARAWANIIN